MADFIYNNNYLLSNLDAQKLYAQSPLTTGVSGTSAYIGIEPSARYNETVLWSGTLNTTGNTIKFTESLQNFERIDFYCAPGNQPIQRAPTIDSIYPGSINPTATMFAYLPVYNVASNTLTGEIMYISASENKLSACLIGGIRTVNFNAATTGVTAYNAAITRIVGINRKEV